VFAETVNAITVGRIISRFTSSLQMQLIPTRCGQNTDLPLLARFYESSLEPARP